MERRLTIFGVPIGQPRARTAVINGQARVYTPSKHPVTEYKAALRQEAGQLFEVPLEGPIGLTVMCVFPRPANKIWKTKPMPRYRHTAKPDGDNIAKAVKDSLNKLAWRDDSQVSLLTIEKWVAAGDEQPRTEVVVVLLD